MASWKECSTLGERLKWVREKKLGHRSTKDTERFLRSLDADDQPEDTSWGSVNRYEKDDRLPKVDYIASIILASGVSARWLLLGEGAPDSVPGTPNGTTKGKVAHAARILVDALEEWEASGEAIPTLPAEAPILRPDQTERVWNARLRTRESGVEPPDSGGEDSGDDSPGRGAGSG